MREIANPIEVKKPFGLVEYIQLEKMKGKKGSGSR